MSEVRNKLSPQAKKLFNEYCNNEEIHSELNVTYKDVADRVISWLYEQPIDIWNEVIKILETEIMASRDKCFTGRLSRLVSSLDGFHPGVRVSIATSDQISNRVLGIMERGKNEGIEKEELMKRIRTELTELEMTEEQMDEWLKTVDDMIE
jgi:hypothetical protein